MPTPTTTIFGTLVTTAVAGTLVQIATDLLEEAASSSMGLKNTYRGTMRVFNLAQLYGYRYDFHLSFKLDDAGQWAHSGHFCARDDDVAKNACAYWFYDLVLTPGTNALAWSFKGSAPDNPLYVDFLDAISIRTPTTSPTALRMVSRRASAPLDKLLAKFNSLLLQGRAAIVADRHGTRLMFARR
jgi:hypothetical protein